MQGREAPPFVGVLLAATPFRRHPGALLHIEESPPLGTLNCLTQYKLSTFAN